MNEPATVTIEEKPNPNLRKLGRALLAIVQQEGASESSDSDGDKAA